VVEIQKWFFVCTLKHGFEGCLVFSSLKFLEHVICWGHPRTRACVALSVRAETVPVTMIDSDIHQLSHKIYIDHHLPIWSSSRFSSCIHTFLDGSSPKIHQHPAKIHSTIHQNPPKSIKIYRNPKNNKKNHQKPRGCSPFSHHLLMARHVFRALRATPGGLPARASICRTAGRGREGLVVWMVLQWLYNIMMANHD